MLPGKPLLGAVTVSLIISTLLATFWPEGSLDGLPVIGLAVGEYTMTPAWIWMYCILWWFVQDALKVCVCYVCICVHISDARVCVRLRLYTGPQCLIYSCMRVCVCAYWQVATFWVLERFDIFVNYRADIEEWRKEHGQEVEC